MNNYVRMTLLAGLSILLAGCQKDSESAGNGSPSTTKDIPFFTPGKGFRHIRTLSSAVESPFIAYQSLDLSVSDGKINWAVDFGSNSRSPRPAFRYTINPATGDTLAVTGKKPNQLADNYTWGNNPTDLDRLDRILFVPYTNNLYLSYRFKLSTFSVDGDVPRVDNLDLSFNRHPRIYANGDICTSFFEVGSVDIARTYSRISTFVWHNGIKTSGAGIDRVLWTYMNQRLDSLWHGGIGFLAGRNGESLAATFDQHNVYLIDQARNIVDKAPFSGKPYRDLSAANTSNVQWTAKTSKDMTTTALLCRDEDRINGGYYYSTFVVNNTTKKITVAVNNAAVKDLQAMDFELDGTLYYATCPNCGNAASETTRIMKVAPGGTAQELAGDFIGRQGVNGLYALNGSVYLAVPSAVQENGRTTTRISLFERN